ncbi:restriction endonuclease [Cytobacillus horneckiae]|uniref:restriction endonuclease n=1 Tax=Cytobacillus horneckiae TaxID=549687 RepID=UPI003D232499
MAFLVIGIFIVNFIYQLIKNWLFHKKMAKSGIRDIDKMDGFQFEVYLKSLFKELGYKPIVTKKSNDFGADLILKGRNKIVIQAKRYGMKNKVSIGAIQEIFAAKAYYKADEAWVITNSQFTKPAKSLAEPCGVKLLDRYDLQAFINKINPEITAKQIYHEVVPEQRKCKICGGSLVIRASTEGNKFMGCCNYPSCNHTESINHAN